MRTLLLQPYWVGSHAPDLGGFFSFATAIFATAVKFGTLQMSACSIRLAHMQIAEPLRGAHIAHRRVWHTKYNMPIA